MKVISVNNVTIISGNPKKDFLPISFLKIHSSNFPYSNKDSNNFIKDSNNFIFRYKKDTSSSKTNNNQKTYTLRSTFKPPPSGTGTSGSGSSIQNINNNTGQPSTNSSENPIDYEE